jgi:hypothetical protein
MATEKQKTFSTKSGAKVSSQVRNYGNEPFFVKKAKDSKVFLKKHGFPRELTIEK